MHSPELSDSLPQSKALNASFHTPGIVMLPIATKGMTFNYKDFVPVNIAVSAPSVMVVKGDSPWKGPEDVVAEAKKNSGELSFSVPGVGTTQFFAGEFQTGDGDRYHPGTDERRPQAIAAVLGGHLGMSFPESGTIVSEVQGGALKALMVMSKQGSRTFRTCRHQPKRATPGSLLTLGMVSSYP